jgi:hypothetical protein
MKFVYFYDNTGEIVYIEGFSEAAITRDIGAAGYVLHDELLDAGQCYVSNGELRPRPLRPNNHYQWDATTEQWVVNAAQQETDVRKQRDELLSTCDWTQLPDVPDETKAAWTAYRQALRDLPEQPGFPDSVDWPALPQTST